MKSRKLTLASVIIAVVLVTVLTVGVLAASSANYQNPAITEETGGVAVMFGNVVDETITVLNDTNPNNDVVFGRVLGSEISFPDKNVQITDDYTGSFDEQGDYIIDLAKGKTLEIGKHFIGEGQRVTFNITSRYDSDIVIGIKSIATGQVYSEILKTGTGSIIIDVPVADEYSLYIENASLTSAKLTVSYIVN